MRGNWQFLSIAPHGSLLLCATGCGIAPPNHADRLPRGMVYYLDGAGAAGITTWVTGVRQGLVNGSHYDTVSATFVAHVIAPLIETAPTISNRPPKAD